MEGRNWEELPGDCLVNVLGRVGMESLLLDVPFVCKSWHKASLNPLCWKALIFPGFWDSFWDRFRDVRPLFKNFNFNSILKFIIDHSRGFCIELDLTRGFNEEILKYAVDNCPALRTLSLLSSYARSFNPEMLGKWKHLEHLTLPYDSEHHLSAIVSEIGLNCKSFIGLHLCWSYIRENEASAIVAYLPGLKILTVGCGYPEEDILVTILQGCEDLVVRIDLHLVGVIKTFAKISMMASRIVFYDEYGRGLST